MKNDSWLKIFQSNQMFLRQHETMTANRELSKTVINIIGFFNKNTLQVSTDLRNIWKRWYLPDLNYLLFQDWITWSSVRLFNQRIKSTKLTFDFRREELFNCAWLQSFFFQEVEFSVSYFSLKALIASSEWSFGSSSSTSTGSGRCWEMRASITTVLPSFLLSFTASATTASMSSIRSTVNPTAPELSSDFA